MDSLLEARIRAVFPQGNDWERDDAQLDANNSKGRLKQVFNRIKTDLPLRIDEVSAWSQTHFFDIHISHNALPSRDDWSKLSDVAKNDCLKESGMPYFTIFFLSVSRVADCYIYYFNHLTPRVGTQYDDHICDEEPPKEWGDAVQSVNAILREHGFLLASREMLLEEVPFVLTWGGDAIPNDDPRWDDDDFEPDPVSAVVYDCLFGDQ